MKKEYKTIKVTLKDGVAVLTINNPPVNQMSPQMGQDFREAVTEAFQKTQVKAVILTGTGKNFIAGADITQLQRVKSKDEIFTVALTAARFLNSIEAGPKPVMAAINGNCLGGGLETAMVCHYRVAAQGGEPGTTRSTDRPHPRSRGDPEAAPPHRASQRHGDDHHRTTHQGGKGLLRGLVDEVVAPEELLETALKAARRFLSGELNLKTRMTRNRMTVFPSAAEKTAMLNYAKVTAIRRPRDTSPPSRPSRPWKRA